jgi:hypothetical protein
MTQTPDEPIPEGTAKPRGISPAAWGQGILGCLGCGYSLIIGIGTIVISSFPIEPGAPKSLEAKFTLGNVNRAQQSYHLENESLLFSLMT